MKKIINIRGGHASGKTTTVREFVNSNKTRVETIYIYGLKTDLTIFEERSIIVLGRYDQEGCVGCDRFKGGNHIKKALYYVANNYKPEVIVYEGIMYSVTCKLSSEISDLSNQLGYEWIGILLYRTIENQKSLMETRDRKKEYNEDNFNAKYRTAMRSFQMLQEIGKNVKAIDVNNFKKQDMKKIIEAELR